VPWGGRGLASPQRCMGYGASSRPFPSAPALGKRCHGSFVRGRIAVGLPDHDPFGSRGWLLTRFDRLDVVHAAAIPMRAESAATGCGEQTPGGWIRGWGPCPLQQLQKTRGGMGCFRIYRASRCNASCLGRCDGRHKFTFRYCCQCLAAAAGGIVAAGNWLAEHRAAIQVCRVVSGRRAAGPEEQRHSWRPLRSAISFPLRLTSLAS
jgi:hypothetical protein